MYTHDHVTGYLGMIHKDFSQICNISKEVLILFININVQQELDIELRQTRPAIHRQKALVAAMYVLSESTVAPIKEGLGRFKMVACT